MISTILYNFDVDTTIKMTRIRVRTFACLRRVI